jgi:tetratricopeptide (TPR) repeat protein
LAVFIALAAGTPARAAAGTASGQFLQETYGGRTYAMGQAYVSLADDIFGLDFNPAGLARIDKAQIATEYGQGFLDAKTNYFGMAAPITANQALGLSYSVFSAGTIDFFDSQGNPTHSASADSEQLIHLGYAYSFRKLPALGGDLQIGVGEKFLDSTLAQEVSAQTFATDLGALYTVEIEDRSRSSLGLSISNIGPGLTYRGGQASGQASDPLPLTLRGGASYQRILSGRDRLTGSLELDDVSGSNSPFVAAFGVEYVYRGLLAVRAGYRFGDPVSPLSFGTGISWSDFSLDYGITLLQVAGDAQKVSLSYAFGVPWVEARGQANATPYDALSKEIQKLIAQGEYFRAMDKVIKRIDLFPKDVQARRDKAAIDDKIQAIVAAGAGTPRFNYAAAHLVFYRHNWDQAVEYLGSASTEDPLNDEIKEHLGVALANVKKIHENERLRAAARISYLYDLAYKASLAADDVKALAILDQILKISNYGPARDLTDKILAAGEEKKRAAAAAAEVQPPPAPEPAPAAEPRRDPGKASELFYTAIRQYSKGDLEGSIKLLKQALELDPDNADVQATLDRAEKEQGETGVKDAPK